MDDKKEEKESYDAEELDSPEEAEEEKSEQPRKFFHSSGSQSDIYAGPQKLGSGKRIFLVLGIIALVGLGTFFYSLRAGSKDSKVSSSPTPLPVVQSTPTPQPSPSFDRTEYTLRVLNGTSTQGLAASTSAKLKELGYKIEKTANATNSAFEKTVVRVKSEQDIFLETLLKDLMPDYNGEKGPELKDSDTSDGEIILGVE